MSQYDPVVPVPASATPRLVGQRRLRRSSSDDPQRVTLHLRHSRTLPSHEKLLERALSSGAHTDHEEFEEHYGLKDAVLERAAAFAEHHGLKLVDVHRAACTVRLEGATAEIERAFGVELEEYHDLLGEHRGHAGDVHLPSDLADCLDGVTGLDSREDLVHAFARSTETLTWPAPKKAPLYDPPEVAELYDFPEGLDGSGQTIGIFEFKGGFNQDDLDAHFGRLGIPLPDISSVLVRQGKNRPYKPDNAFRETNLDIQTVGAIAPGAKYVIYLADEEASFIDLLNAAVFDRDEKPSILSISFGGAEKLASPSYWRTVDRSFERAAALGITICVSSGDGGSGTQYYDQVGSRGAHVNSPASSPHVLACGGTSLYAKKGEITHEGVWNDLGQSRAATGGGISVVFPRPDWQKGFGLPKNRTRGVTFKGRGVPDVAGNADPMTGYRITVAGQPQRIGGTSAVAPLWAGLIARMNQGLGRNLGFVNPLLYSLGGKGFVQVSEGNNGAYAAGRGWNACTGLGRPNGKKLFKAIRKALGKS